jgi:acyl-CoA thioesterase FadM
VRTRERVVLPTGVVAADASAVLVARDRSTRTSRPITPPERAAFERDLAAAPATASPAD